MAVPFIEMKNISKSFSGVHVLKSVNFSCDRGEIHGLIGANGAGKSTLIKTLSGIYGPDGGEIMIDGRHTVINSPAEAAKLGIGVIHQEFDLIPQMTAAENMYLGREPHKPGLLGKLGGIDFNRLYEDTAMQMDRVGLRIQPWQRISELSVEQKQLLAIAKVLSLDAQLLIMDEPTAALNGTEVEHLLSLISDISRRGCGVVFISHHMEEVFQISQNITVLRDGQVIACRPAGQLSQQEAVKMMTGKETVQKRLTGLPPRERHVFEAQNLCRTGSYENVSLSLREGEVVGMVGLEGQGQREILRSLYGDLHPDSGTVLMDGKTINLSEPAQALNHGIVFVPEERKEEGLCLLLDVCQNIALSTLKERCRAGIIHRAEEHKAVEQLMKDVHLLPPDPQKIVGFLSGGNQQKVVIARCLACRPKVLLFAEPTRGIDVGAKEEIYRMIRSMADAGSSILMVSGDLSELSLVCDRILVVFRGHIVDCIDGATAERERIMRSMWGLGNDSAEERDVVHG